MRRLDLKKAQAARSNTIRDINRQIVLNYVREREPISRAEISRKTDLQRSTISTIIDGLRDDGMIEEVGAGESTGGRPPTLLRLRAAGAVAIGIDIALSRTVVATCDLAGRVLEQEEFLTNASAEKTLAQATARASALIEKHKGSIEGIGVSLPGLVDSAAGTAIYIPYFKWRELPVKRDLTAATGLPVIVDNDANAAALAELWFGRPEISDARDFIMLLVTAGIGTGIVFDGQVYKGMCGAAGEYGHMIVGSKAPIACSCGNYDCWEAFASERAALARYSKESGQANNGNLSFAQLVERALGGERAAQDALTQTAYYLGIGIANLIVGSSPEAVIVSGAIVQAWPLIADALHEGIERSARRGLPPSRVVASTLGDQPTLMGALSLVLASKFASALAS